MVLSANRVARPWRMAKAAPPALDYIGGEISINRKDSEGNAISDYGASRRLFHRPRAGA